MFGRKNLKTWAQSCLRFGNISVTEVNFSAKRICALMIFSQMCSSTWNHYIDIIEYLHNKRTETDIEFNGSDPVLRHLGSTVFRKLYLYDRDCGLLNVVRVILNPRVLCICLGGVWFLWSMQTFIELSVVKRNNFIRSNFPALADTRSNDICLFSCSRVNIYWHHFKTGALTSSA